ncbi:glucokinase [Murinocardiopsis flavida]|uniref:Glucokinase n=1 Tax=Murinocardiopsis flavida TaxID=645275 RepID=A0A2P8D9A3_9ACTN|nr:ROK family protein [Murinocardiopsis flavida]PSK93804.1 glucokinase [Murinocardiopsis flavida]
MDSRRRTALRLVTAPATADPTPAIGAVDLLPGRIRAALLDMGGAFLRRSEVPYPAASVAPREFAALLGRAVRECFGARRPCGIGIAAAGLVDPATGVILEVNDVPGLRGYPVAEVLTGLTGLPVHIEHRARVQVMGDRWFGPGRGRASFASVATGEVLGVGILYEGRVLAPPGGRSGAHMTVAASGRACTCGARGCWKTVATDGWLRERAAALGLPPGTGVGALAAAAGRGGAAAALLDEYAANLALGLANVQQLCAPGLFVLHGGARGGGERLRAGIESRLRDAASGTGAPAPEVRFSEETGDDAALLGGAGLVLSEA